MKHWIFLSLVCVSFFSSCSIRQDIFLDAAGGGKYSGTFQVSEDLAGYLAELATLTMDSSEEFSLFEPERIREDLEKDQSGLKVTNIVNSDAHSLRVDMNFDSLEQLFRSEKVQESEIIRFEKHPDGKRTVHIHLDRENYRQLDSLFSDEQAIVMDTFGPKENKGLTEDEYLEMMSFALGETGPDLVKNSVIETRVTVAGTLLDQKGGVREGNSVVFRIPLIRILLLDQELDYQLTFR